MQIWIMLKLRIIKISKLQTGILFGIYKFYKGYLLMIYVCNLIVELKI
jgi:hypothetical protein